MKLKTVKRMNACVLSAAMVLSGVTIIPPATVSAAANNEINYALSGTATVSDQETNYWGADKAIDGIVNRDAAKADQSRWATNQSTSQAARTLTVNLATQKTFDHFVIEWERTNITNFKISVCDTEDGEYRDVYVKNDGENITSVTVTFQKIGVYSYDDIQIVCQPMDSYTDEINTLKENVLTDVELGNNKVTGQITLDRNKYLCLTIPYSKGWKVYVDGERQKLYNANGQYMAVYLTSGTHNVTLKYSTPLLKEGALVSLAGVVIFAMQLVINNRKKRE